MHFSPCLFITFVQCYACDNFPQVLELSVSYTPEVSSYKVRLVTYLYCLLTAVFARLLKVFMSLVSLFVAGF